MAPSWVARLALLLACTVAASAAPGDAHRQPLRQLGRRLAQSPPSVPLLPSATDPPPGAPPDTQIVTTTTTVVTAVPAGTPPAPGASPSDSPSASPAPSPSPSPAAQGSFPSDARVVTSIALGGIATTCDKYSTETQGWARDPSVRYDASGGSKPDAQAVSKLVQTICNSTAREAGKQVLGAIQAGGSQAEIAVAALFQEAPSQCQDAGNDAYVTAADGVNTGAVADLQATQQFFTNLVAAANGVGLPMCMSIAVLDKAGGAVLGSFEYHTGTAI